MSQSASTAREIRYTVAIPVYEGPLDLLLQLIERAELDITKVSLAQVTDQYLNHLKKMEERNAEEVSSFLVIAAKLIQIKSEALLPRPPEREPGEEDPGEALARQLILYKQFKQVAEGLGERDALGLRTYLRLAPPPRMDGKVDLEGIGLEDLYEAAREVIARTDGDPELRGAIITPRVTIREKIRVITRTLREAGRATFQTLLGQATTRVEIVVTFLALLELVKRQRILAVQESIFGEIALEKTELWEENPDFELEFED